MDLVLHPYPLSSVNAFTYSFVTEKGVEYYCSFVSYAEYFQNHPKIAQGFFAFNLELRDKNVRPRGIDKRIADTVITIVGDFLEGRNNAVVYVCDNSDGKEAVRARKFKSWFEYYDHPSSQIIQINDCLHVGGILLYCALLLHRKNKHKGEFAHAFLELTSDEEK